MKYLSDYAKAFLKLFGVFISRKPAKFYYDLEDEVISSLIKASNGVIHIGAHYGQEANLYNDLNKKVIWIEALPIVYEKLLSNVEGFENQKAFCALLGDREEKNVKMHLSNNDYSASSIYLLDPNSGFDKVRLIDETYLPMTTLDLLLISVEKESYNHWILDVQGAELLVLKGSTETLKYCNSIVVEVSSRPTYIGGVEYEELKLYLFSNGFTPLWNPLKNDHTNIPFIRF
jgi:FkbM family methyltransferase